MKSIKRSPLPALISAITVLLCGCGNESGLPDASACVPLGVGGLYLEAAPATVQELPLYRTGLLSAYSSQTKADIHQYITNPIP